jgi:hypothetical protein
MEAYVTLSPYDVAARIVACAYDAVDHGAGLTIARLGVVPGEIAWDDCACGQLVISEDRRYPSRAFPLEEIDYAANCGEPWLVVVFTLSMTRCVPGPDQNGNPPSVAALQVAAAQLMTDKLKIRRAVMCCLNELYDAVYPADTIDAFHIGAQETIGPNGGCGGSEMQILIGYTQDCEC